jgi:hypothetical protein
MREISVFFKRTATQIASMKMLWLFAGYCLSSIVAAAADDAVAVLKAEAERVVE